jgi:hypothetical protein
MTAVTVQSGGECQGSSHHESYLTNGYDVPWTILFGDAGQFCVHLENVTSTNVSVRAWVVDTESNGEISDSGFSTSVQPSGGVTNLYFSDLGMRGDGVTPQTEAELHLVVHNDDSESTGVEIWHSVWY